MTYYPSRRPSADGLVHMEWMQQWGLPALKGAFKIQVIEGLSLSVLAFHNPSCVCLANILLLDVDNCLSR